MRHFGPRLVTIPAGKIWPDTEQGLPLPWFRYWLVENRGAPGSGNDIWVGFDARPNAAQAITADAVVPAGVGMTKALAGESDEEGDAHAGHTMWLLNVGAAAVNVLVELSEDEIKLNSWTAVASPAAIVAGTQSPGDGIANPADAVDVRAFLEGVANNGQWFRAGVAATNADNQPALVALIAASYRYVFNPITGGWDKVREVLSFKTGVANAAGNTVIWTPAAGRRFRLMGYSIEITGNASAAAAGVNEITLNDAGAPIGQGVSAFVPAAAGAAVGNVQLSGGMRQLGNGYLSAAVNQSLQVNLSAALATGEVRVTAIGTEE